MRIATWNINSLRLRLPLVQQLHAAFAPDILCLQETKVQDMHFPQEALTNLGYTHIAFCGEKSYNGVAILSKMPLHNVQCLKWAGFEDARHISAVLPSGEELHNFYVPAGGDEPDVTVNPKFAHKLAFVDHMREWFQTHRKAHDPLILVGDLNIAPLPDDVWSHKQLLTVVSHTAIEVEKLTALQQGLGWIDTARHFVPATEKLYSWWSYRNQDWRKSDRGRRLDHIWVTAPLTSKLQNTHILKEVRDWLQPSDHVPVVTDFAKN